MKLYSHLIFAAVLAASGQAFASGWLPDSPFTRSAAGTTAASFIKEPIGARYEAMGGSGTALYGPYSVFWNPAGLGVLTDNGCGGIVSTERGSQLPDLEHEHTERSGCQAVTFSQQNQMGDYKKTAASYAVPMLRGVFSLGMIQGSHGGLERYNTVGDFQGGFDASDTAFIGAYAYRWQTYFGTMDVGGAVKYLHSKIDDASGSAMAFDAGMIIHNTQRFSALMEDLAIFVRNFGAPMKMGNESDPLPLELGIGNAMHITKYLQLHGDFRLPSDRNPFFTFGMEAQKSYKIEEWDRYVFGALRAGYNTKYGTDMDFNSAWSIGFGLGMEPINIDYAYIPRGDWGTTSRISLQLVF